MNLGQSLLRIGGLLLIAYGQPHSHAQAPVAATENQPAPSLANLSPSVRRTIEPFLTKEYQEEIRAKAKTYAQKYGDPVYVRRFTHPRATYRDKVAAFNNTLLWETSLGKISPAAAAQVGNPHIGLYQGDLLKVGFALGNAAQQDLYLDTINRMLAQELVTATAALLAKKGGNLREMINLKNMINQPTFRRTLLRSLLAQILLEFGEVNATIPLGSIADLFQPSNESAAKPVALSVLLQPFLAAHLRRAGVVAIGAHSALDWLKNNRWISAADETLTCITIKTAIFEFILLKTYLEDFALPALVGFVQDHDTQLLAAAAEENPTKRAAQLRNLQRPLLRTLRDKKSRWLRERNELQTGLTVALHLVLNAKTIWKAIKLFTIACDAQAQESAPTTSHGDQ